MLFSKHPGTRIAVAGSYGKTTMKEILLTVLSEGKKVAATPATKNVPISHAKFAQSLKGDEEILIIEYGEGAPGDIQKFNNYIRPHKGIITGLAPAHLDRYKSLDSIYEDFISLVKYLDKKDVYVNYDSEALKYYLHYSGFNNSFLRTKYRKNIKKGTYQRYSSHQVGPWQVSDAKIDINGVKFTLSRGRTNLHLNSGLLGRHQIGPLALSAVFGMELGLTEEQVKTGVAKTKPFEHRMEPKQLSGGWLIDDTYNGNIEGMKAGLALLKELPAKRKVYITPGLVAQGKQSKEIHEELGREIAKANPDLVVLIQHSITDDIINGIKKGGYKGELRIESDPLDFYTNLKHFVAAGDIILMQNDWPDQYE